MFNYIEMQAVVRSLNITNLILLKALPAKLQSALGYIIAFITKTCHLMNTQCEGITAT